MLLWVAGVSAQTTSLPAPQIENGPAVLGILAQRQSTNAFANRPLTDQDLANGSFLIHSLVRAVRIIFLKFFRYLVAVVATIALSFQKIVIDDKLVIYLLQ